jgi:hypothetical protein
MSDKLYAKEIAACVRLNLWCKWVATPDGTVAGRWQSCDRDEPQAQPDLNTLFASYRWNRDQEMYLIKEKLDVTTKEEREQLEQHRKQMRRLDEIVSRTQNRKGQHDR